MLSRAFRDRPISPSLKLSVADAIRVPNRLIGRICSSRSYAVDPRRGHFERCSLTLRGSERHFLVHVPKEYHERTKWPAVLFLHGAGERGQDGYAPAAVGLGPALAAYPERYRAIVVIPQCRHARQWIGEEAEYAIAALQKVVDTMSLDEERVAITGISMGGAGALLLASRFPERFRAVASIAGWGDSTALAAKLQRTPVWLFHGADDRIVPVTHSRLLKLAFDRCERQRVRYTEYPGLGHASWDAAYGELTLPGWLVGDPSAQPL